MTMAITDKTTATPPDFDDCSTVPSIGAALRRVYHPDVLESFARRRPRPGKAARLLLTVSIVVPVACIAISELAHAPGPMIPFFDPSGPVYLDFFTALGALSSLLLLGPGAFGAYKCFGTAGAIVLTMLLLGLCFLCVHHVTFS